MPDGLTPIGQLRKYQAFLEKERSFWDKGVWVDIVENLLPYREDLNNTKEKGKRKAKKIYDSTPQIYLNTFADGMHGNMINPAIQWFILRLPRKFQFLEEIIEVKKWLQETQESLYYAFGESNFYSAMRQYFKDGGSIGTATVFIDQIKEEQKLVFHVLHPRESYLAENRHGQIDVIFRKFMMTARNMEDFFGKDQMSNSAQQALKTNPFEEFEIINAIYPNNEFDDSKLGNKSKKFASKWFENKTENKGNDSFLREKGHDLFPAMVWRYFKGENGVYGDSPAVFALPEIMGLQAMRKTLLRAGHLAADPAYNIPSEMGDDARIHPGAHNFYGPDSNRKITPITTGINYPIGFEFLKDTREQLKKHFHVDFFLLLEQAERQMTAREVIERMGEKAAILSASVGDLTIVLDSIIDFVFDMELKAKRIPDPPDILIQHIGGKRIPIEYMGPLAQVQKRLFETRGIVDSIQIAAPYAQAFPQVSDLVDHDKTFKELLTSFGFPQDNFNSPETVQLIREGRAVSEQDANKKIDMERLAEVLKKLSQAQKNSPEMSEQIDAILGGVTGGVAVPTA